MAEKRSEDPERRRRDPETLARGGADDAATAADRVSRDVRAGPDPTPAGAEPAAGEEGTGRRLDVTSLVLVVVVIALLALLAYVLFATREAGAPRADADAPASAAAAHAA